MVIFLVVYNDLQLKVLKGIRSPKSPDFGEFCFVAQSRETFAQRVIISNRLYWLGYSPFFYFHDLLV
jgi:hypothetical protein